MPLAPPSSKHIHVLRAFQARAHYLLTTREFAHAAGQADSASAAKTALDRLTAAGYLATLDRRGRRLIVPPEHDHYGAPPIDWWIDDLLSEREPCYYVALLSAARHWGSAHQALQTTHVMVAKPRRETTVGRRGLTFFTKTSIASTPVVTVSGSVARWRVSTREATVLDLLHHSAKVGGVEAVARIVRDLLPALEARSLTDALHAQAQRASAQRLGFVLERLGAPARLVDPVREWLKGDVRATGKPLQVQLLDRGSGAANELIDADWRVRLDDRHVQLIEESA